MGCGRRSVGTETATAAAAGCRGRDRVEAAAWARVAEECAESPAIISRNAAAGAVADKTVDGECIRVETVDIRFPFILFSILTRTFPPTTTTTNYPALLAYLSPSPSASFLHSAPLHLQGREDGFSAEREEGEGAVDCGCAEGGCCWRGEGGGAEMVEGEEGAGVVGFGGGGGGGIGRKRYTNR